MEGVSPGYDVYKKLRQNLEKPEGPMVVKEMASDTPQEEREVAGLQMLADAAAHATQIGCTPKTMSTTEERSSPSTHGISPNLLNLIQPPKAKSRNQKSVRLTNTLPDHVTSPDTIRTMALNQLKFAKQKAERERKAKVKFQSRLEKCPKTVTSAQSHSLQKRAKTLSTVETLCSVCMGSFEEEAKNSIIMTWIQCEKCQKWLHKDCIPLNFEYDLNVFEDDEIQFTCHFCSL